MNRDVNFFSFPAFDFRSVREFSFPGFALAGILFLNACARRALLLGSAGLQISFRRIGNPTIALVSIILRAIKDRILPDANPLQPYTRIIFLLSPMRHPPSSQILIILNKILDFLIRILSTRHPMEPSRPLTDTPRKIPIANRVINLYGQQFFSLVHSGRVFSTFHFLNFRIYSDHLCTNNNFFASL